MKDPANERRAYLPILPQAMCPATTGGRFPSTLAVDWSELVGQRAIVTILVCLVCGKEHAWPLDEVSAMA